MRRLIFLIPMIMAGCSLPAIGAMYHINPQLSSLVLTWKMIGGGEYHARITGIRGDLSYDPREDDRNTLQSAIPVRQLDAHHWVLTRALRSRTFFDTAATPMPSSAAAGWWLWVRGVTGCWAACRLKRCVSR